MVIFDSPPALAASPAAELAEHVGQAVLVCRADTHRPQRDSRMRSQLLGSCPDIKLLLNDAHFSPSGRPLRGLLRLRGGKAHAHHQAHSSRLLALIALAALLASAGAALAQDGRRRRCRAPAGSDVTPYIEAAQIVYAELQPGSDIVTYTSRRGGRRCQPDRRRNSAASVSLRYERRIGWDDEAARWRYAQRRGPRLDPRPSPTQ